MSAPDSMLTVPLGAPKPAPKKDSAVAKCADFIMRALQEAYVAEQTNGLTWETLISKAGQHGMKPKTMRLARTYLRCTAKVLVLYQCKSPGTRSMKYMWALAAQPLPANAEVLDTYDDDADETYGFASLAAAVAGAAAQRAVALPPLPVVMSKPSAAGVPCLHLPGSPAVYLAQGDLGAAALRSAKSMSPDASGSYTASGSLAREASLSSPARHPAAADMEHSGGEDTDDAMRGSADGETNNRVGGGVGQRLRYEDLQAQFGVGLGDAAANLGVCKTTLKRACRSHGIRRWPRKQIAKLSKALSTVTKHGLMPTQVGLPPVRTQQAAEQQQQQQQHGHGRHGSSSVQLGVAPPQQQVLRLDAAAAQAQAQRVHMGERPQQRHLASCHELGVPAMQCEAGLQGGLLSMLMQQQQQRQSAASQQQQQQLYTLMASQSMAGAPTNVVYQQDLAGSLVQCRAPQLQAVGYGPRDIAPLIMGRSGLSNVPSSLGVRAAYGQQVAYSVGPHLGGGMAAQNVVSCPPYSVIILG